MKYLTTVTSFALLKCLIITTLYQKSTCSAEEQQNAHTQTGTMPPPESQHYKTFAPHGHQCTNSIHGFPGIPGNPGMPGVAGPLGPPGSKGEAGQTGHKGDKGELGPKGESQEGQKGTQGDPGHKGDKGDPGQKGEGHSGEKGVQGKPGPRGDRGDPGLKGSKGQSGPPGLQGQPGQPGQKGDKGHAGETQNSTRVAFSVSRTTALGPVSGDTAVTYDKVYTNMGDGYDMSTGKFTCSVGGVYFFMITALRNNANNMFACLMKNSTQLPCIYVSHSSSRSHGSASNSVIIDLGQGDQVWVKLGTGYALQSFSNEYVTFTGYLLYQSFSEN
ncbi:complement C1q tumor necrosis factor-related protein 5-like [Ptychodera flava]|uniref:complement C1q tumor necrosis factor-related protein 5-like n=1 Tax=Ptychodera flava TaxID=63121 RepID=UPI00396A4993